MKCNKIIFNMLTLFSVGKLILKKLNSINKNIKLLMMATQADFDAIISRIDASTTFLANEVRTLQEEIKAQGLPQDAEDSILGKLGDLASRLEAIGSSTDDALPGIVGSTTPAPLRRNTDDSTASNAQGDTKPQPPVTDANTGENTPKSDGAKTDNESANVVYNPKATPAEPLPGDKQTVLSGNVGVENASIAEAKTDKNSGKAKK